MTKCSVPVCERPAREKGLCTAHAHRLRRHGDPLGGRTFNGEPRKFLAAAKAYDGNDCLLWPYATDGHGYGHVKRWGESPQKVHRLVCEAVKGPPPFPKAEALHSCGNGHLGCCAPKHLRWGTHADNGRDMVAHGRQRDAIRAARRVDGR